MKFDKLSKLIIEQSRKSSKYEKLIVGNSDPVFTTEDILRDPTDPSKGTKLYLSGPEEKKKGLEPGDPRSLNRQVRRVNWVAKKLIKKYRNREVSVDRLMGDIREMLEQYQTKVLGWKKADSANTTYETRVLSNLFLPPTGKNPRGKSVFIAPGMDPNATVDQASKQPKVKRERGASKGPSPMTAEEIYMSADAALKRLEATTDMDLRDVIMHHAKTGGTIRDVLKDPRIEDQYESDVVKFTIKGMIKSGLIDKEGSTLTTASGQSLADKIRGRIPNRPLDVDATDQVSDEDEDVSVDISAEDEEDHFGDDIPGDAPEWYPEEDGGQPEEEEEEEEDNEYKSLDDMDEDIFYN